MGWCKSCHEKSGNQGTSGNQGESDNQGTSGNQGESDNQGESGNETFIEQTEVSGIQSVLLVWEDNNDAKNIRPASVKMHFKDSEDNLELVTVSANENWGKQFNEPKTYVNIQEILGYHFLSATQDNGTIIITHQVVSEPNEKPNESNNGSA